MSLTTLDPVKEITSIVDFIHRAYESAGVKKAVVAVSGGIDSAVVLTLLTRALGQNQVAPLLLPYQQQSMTMAKLAVEFNQINPRCVREIQIEPIVAALAQQLGGELTIDHDRLTQLRLGNLMARCRMMLIYDVAKELTALVSGTENKSEKYLGYFTRFGDEASDLEPIQHLYKTQVIELAKYLKIPDTIIAQSPSAGLWEGQTDEQELGFNYSQADQILEVYLGDQKRDQYLDRNISPTDLPEYLPLIHDLIVATKLPRVIIQAVIVRVESQWYKQQVPYHL